MNSEEAGRLGPDDAIEGAVGIHLARLVIEHQHHRAPNQVGAEIVVLPLGRTG